MFRAGLAAAAVTCLAWLGQVQPAQSQVKPSSYLYSAPAYCGRVIHPGSISTYPAVPVAPGTYYTSVTIRNAGAPVTLTRRVAVAFRGTPGNSTGPLNITLGTGQSIVVDCEHMRAQASITGNEAILIGDLLVQSPREVEVTAAHTSSPLTGGPGSFQVLRVIPRPL